MHELPATEGILAIALETAGNGGYGRVTAIDVVIGELTSIVDDSVQFYFDVLSRGTAAAGARLHMRREPATAQCSSCRVSYPVVPPLMPTCMHCGALTLRIEGGRQFYIESIEVEE